MSDFKHYTVMLNEAVDALECKDVKVYVDCTLGGGGHSELILKRISPNGRLISFDIDDEAIAHASERLKSYKNLTIVKSSYTNIKSELKKLGIEKIDGGVIIDLGASYHQLTKAERGFSFHSDDRRFTKHDTFILDIDKAVGSAKVHTQVRGKEPSQVVYYHVLVHQFNNGHLGIIPLADAGTVNAAESTGTSGIARSQNYKQFL